MDSKEKLEERRAKLIVYLQMKVEEMDWHGVQDAGSDLREVDAKLSMIKD